MEMTLRWFGPSDAVTLARIRQIPGVRGVVGALHEVPPGEVWPRDAIDRLVETIGSAGLRLPVVESLPVHEDIKLGRTSRDRLADAYAQSLRNLGEAGIGVVCYNFMPAFDWTRSSLDTRLEDGSTTLAFDPDRFGEGEEGPVELPGWMVAQRRESVRELIAAYRQVDADALWANLAYFLERVVPAAAGSGVRLALHPDDPPWSIFGLPRIVTDLAALDRVLGLVEDPANGITFCTGSLGVLPGNDLPSMVRRLGARIHFVHCRNVRVTGEHRFHETAHPSAAGDVDMRAVLEALHDVGFTGPMRPDHGRMIWEETGRPGYGLYDRALGATYLQGLWEGIASPRRDDRTTSTTNP